MAVIYSRQSSVFETLEEFRVLLLKNANIRYLGDMVFQMIRTDYRSIPIYEPDCVNRFVGGECYCEGWYIFRGVCDTRRLKIDFKWCRQ